MAISTTGASGLELEAAGAAAKMASCISIGDLYS